MSQYIIAQRYAKALYQLACEENVLDAVYADMTALNGLMHSVEGLNAFVNNPLFSLPERERVMDALFRGKLHHLTAQTIRFLIHKNRLNCLDEMVVAFEEFYFTSHAQIKAFVQTALPITDDQKQTIVNHLSKKVGKRVVVQWEINRSLIGGFRVFMDGKLFDYSFSHQLEQFKQHVLTADMAVTP